MIRLPLGLIRCVLCLRPWRHSGRWGWTVCLDGEPTEWHRTMGDALHALRELER